VKQDVPEGGNQMIMHGAFSVGTRDDEGPFGDQADEASGSARLVHNQ
jgi:UbiD family decarboxylase